MPADPCAEYKQNDANARARIANAQAELVEATANITYPPSTGSEPIIHGSAAGVVNAPVTWPELLGGWLTDAPFFILAALTIIGTWLQSGVPITSRGIVTVAVLAILAGLTAVQRATGSDGLSLRLRAKGQIGRGE